MGSRQANVAWLFAMHAIMITAHTINDMLPLFFGGSIGSPHGSGVVPAEAEWATITQYLFPGIVVLVATLTRSRIQRWIALVLAVLLAAMNQMHWFGHVQGEAGSAAITILTAVQISLYALIYQCWKWAREQ